MGGNRLPTKVMHCNVKGKGNTGRQPKTWTDNIKEDPKERNMDIKAAYSGGDSRQRDVETDRTTSSSVTLMDKKQQKEGYIKCPAALSLQCRSNST